MDELERTRRYYDDFAERYDDQRGGRVPGGYHDLVDELEVGFVERFARGKSVLEVGCGTGLLLREIAEFATEVTGVDLSPGMLQHARRRGLNVHEARADALPFPHATFDVACSFKVLPHVEPVHAALREMLRVVRPGGVVVAEFYNQRSLRGLVKRWSPAGRISASRSENDVLTRFDTPEEALALLPDGCWLEAVRGVRILTPAAQLLRVPGLGSALNRAERALCDTPLRAVAGFWIAAFRKGYG